MIFNKGNKQKSYLGDDATIELSELNKSIEEERKKSSTPPAPSDLESIEFEPEKIEEIVEVVKEAPKRRGRPKKIQPAEEKDQFNAYLPVSMIDKLDAIRMKGVKRARKAPSWAEVMKRLIDTYEEKNGKIRLR